MKGCSSLGLRLFLTAILSAAMASIAVADDRFEIGDEVEVLILGQWQPGKVVNTNRQGAVLAEFSFAGGKNREILAPNFVRHECELGAVAPVREWQDASGKFKIRASVVQNDGKTVKLRKLDLEEIDVPVDALSKSNQRFLRGVKKGAAPMWPATRKSSGQDHLERAMAEMQERMSGRHEPEPDPVSQLELPRQIAFERFAICEQFGAQEGAPADVTDRVALTPDPLPGYLTLQNGGTYVPNDSIFAVVSPILPVGGPDGWLLAAILEDSAKPSPTQVIWVSLARNKVEGRQLLPAGEVVLDYHAPSHRMLTRAGQERFTTSTVPAEDRPLTVWEVLPSDSQVTPIARWNPSADKPKSSPDKVVHGMSPKLWQGFADGNTVIHQWNPREIVAWDIAAKRMRYRVVRNLEKWAPPILSGSRKYLFVPDIDGVRILDSLTGRTLSVLTTDQPVWRLAITDDGRRLVTTGKDLLHIWELTDASQAPQEHQVGVSRGSVLRWQNDKRFWTRVGSRTMGLYSLEIGAIVWSFQTTSNTGKFHDYDIVRDRVAFACRKGWEPLTKQLFVGAIDLPGPGMEEAEAAFDPDSLIALGPVARVKIVVEAGEYKDRVQAALETKVQENGWIIDPNSSTVLTATMGRSEPQKITYYESSGTQSETVTVTPHFSRIVLEHEGKELLNTGVGDRTPRERYDLREGETIQQKIDETASPRPDFFEWHGIPKIIYSEKRGDGMGTTYISDRGRRVVESKP